MSKIKKFVMSGYIKMLNRGLIQLHLLLNKLKIAILILFCKECFNISDALLANLLLS